MKADDARKLAADATAEDNVQVKAVLESWHRAIEKAAKQGRNYVEEREVARLRMPITAASRRAALDKLQMEGFVVVTIEDRNESVTRVSW